MNINEAQKIHCIGIGGIGVSALAQLWHARGKQVSGSDAAESELTRELEEQGIQVGSIPNSQFPISNKMSNVKGQMSDVDLVVYSDAVPEYHPERVEARRRGIQEMSYAQSLGEVSRQYRTIVVTGTHGKSTTTALLGLMLEAAGMDPLVIVGTRVPAWGNSNLRLPQGTLTPNPLPQGEGVFQSIPSPRGRGEGEGQRWFIVEGDDYRDHFLELQPYAVVVTNIEHDHPDYFQDLEQTVESFKKLGKKVSEGGFMVLNKDDSGCQQLFSIRQHSNILENVGMLSYGRSSGIFSALTLQVPGEFNRYNATAAATAAMELGVAQDIVERMAQEFKGVWRRFEIVGQFHDSRFMIHNSPTIISDYGHHPTAIAATMKAARQFYPDQRLVLVYQPHQHSRTKRLFNDFVRVLRDAADVVIISEIYAVKGRMEEQDINSQQLVDEITKLRNYEITNVLYGGDLEQTKRAVLERMKPGDVIIFMGAGDIDNLARAMVKQVEK